MNKLKVSKNFGGQTEVQRTSNLELFRIFTMVLIVAHHYVVNSGLTVVDGPLYADPVSWKSLFLFVFGAWGKIGINCFVLITGYFMCTSSISLKKYLRLIGTIVVYKVVFYILFLLTGYELFSIKGFLQAILPITFVSWDFCSCFLLFYLCIPFLNILLSHISEKKTYILIVIISFYVCIFWYCKNNGA